MNKMNNNKTKIINHSPLKSCEDCLHRINNLNEEPCKDCNNLFKHGTTDKHENKFNFE